MSESSTTAFRENLIPGDCHHDFDAAIIADDVKNIVDSSAYSKDIKKRKLSHTRKKKTDLDVLFKESILDHEERIKDRKENDGRKIRPAGNRSPV